MRVTLLEHEFRDWGKFLYCCIQEVAFCRKHCSSAARKTVIFRSGLSLAVANAIKIQANVEILSPIICLNSNN